MVEAAWVAFWGFWLLILLIAFSYLLPRTVSVRRQVLVEAPSTDVFFQLNDARNWPQWFPWEQQNEETSVTCEGSETGKGATRKWKSASGTSGQQVIVDVDPPDYLRMSLEIDRYGGGHAEWFIEPKGESARLVTCVMRLAIGTTLRKRWRAVFLRSQVAEELEEGLQALKAAAESSRNAKSSEPV